MLKKLKQLNSKGFTIIEVLIVLAIAGLIMLIVFLAVPALQRNSRNTQLRSDVSSILGHVNEYMSNNSGDVPSDICSDTTNGNLYISKTIPASCTAGTLAGKIRNDVTINAELVCTSLACAYAAPAMGTITPVLNAKCNGSSALTYTARSISMMYVTETASTQTPQCLTG